MTTAPYPRQLPCPDCGEDVWLADADEEWGLVHRRGSLCLWCRRDRVERISHVDLWESTQESWRTGGYGKAGDGTLVP